MDMTTFGTSAYIKLLAVNSRTRDTIISSRLLKTPGKGYDFHKAMRAIAPEFAGQFVDWAGTRAKLKAIAKPAERRSAIDATFALARWVGGRPIKLLSKDSVLLASSPNARFAVKFCPDFEIDLDGQTTRIHIWNTKHPSLKIREAIGALGLFVCEREPRSIAILSLRSGELFVPTEYESARSLARYLALDIERSYSRLSSEVSSKSRVAYPADRRALR
jgi:hypothetical protein